MMRVVLALCLVAVTVAAPHSSEHSSSGSHEHSHSSHQHEDPIAKVFKTGKGYKELFPDVPTTVEILAHVDMTTQIVQEQTAFEKDNFDPNNPRIDTVMEGRVYSAVGYSLGYATIVVLDNDELLLIDAPESYPQGQKMLADFRAIPAIGDKQITHIVLSLFHLDHVWGLRAFTDEREAAGLTPAVLYMHKLSPVETEKFDTWKAIKLPRIFKQFGYAYLPDPWHLHDGAGPLRIQPSGTTYFSPVLLDFPTEDTVLTKNFGGTPVEFRSAPGYTVDQIQTYFPSLRTLHVSDTFYYSFLNVYTLRGEPARDCDKWAGDLKKAFQVENVDYYVASHTWFFTDPERMVFAHDALRAVHDQTLRYMMKGETSDIICSKIKLPEVQLRRDVNNEVYGIFETACKSVFDFYVGWFSGEVEDMFPVNRKERADNMVALVGKDKLVKEAGIAYFNKNYRWAMEVVSWLATHDPQDRQSKELRTLVMIRLAELQYSVNSRHYYLATALQLWGHFPVKVNGIGGYSTLPFKPVLKNLAAHVNAEKLDLEDTAAMNAGTYVAEKVLGLDMGANKFKLVLRNSILDWDPVTSFDEGVMTWTVPEGDFRAYLVQNVFAGTVTNGVQADVENWFTYIDFVDQV